MENDTPIYVNNSQFQNVESCIYLGQRYSIRDKNQKKEIHRRITAGWTAFAKHGDIFKGDIGTCLKRQVYNVCVTSSNDIRRGNMGIRHSSKNKLAAHKQR
ncbi:hypothetical protein NP493_641g01035 [Ridgeia piscesae]|uniref:Uncharacterized protein n=1 Tax=Ridgeia piscesae TaxID=27915 RepID=A0AAD9KSM8_RIDPI|nr:hypothetical protein NP493_641g01035 [Ridgeia piscesae]